MLDVHPPDHAPHSWRDFFIHIATICVGLLIAIGLEQTVEAVHHHRELRDFRESLRRDDEKSVQDCDRFEGYIRASNNHSNLVAAPVREAYAGHHSLALPAYEERTDADLPADPTWQAAKSSGLLALVPQNEIELDAEIGGAVDMFNAAFPAFEDAVRKVFRFESRWRLQSGSTAIPPEEMQAYLDLIADKMDQVKYLELWNHQLRAATASVLQGETNLDVVQKAEH